MERVGPDRVRFSAGDTGAWILASQTINEAGQAVDAIDVSQFAVSCDSPPGTPSPDGVEDPRKCFIEQTSRLGYHQMVTYHPADRFWALQGIETALYLGLSAGLVGYCLWRIRRSP